MIRTYFHNLLLTPKWAFPVQPSLVNQTLFSFYLDGKIPIQKKEKGSAWFTRLSATYLVLPKLVFPMQPTANPEAGLPSATSVLLTPKRAFLVQSTANAEAGLPSATYC